MPPSPPPTPEPPELIAVLTAAAVTALGREARITSIESLDDSINIDEFSESSQPPTNDEATP